MQNIHIILILCKILNIGKNYIKFIHIMTKVIYYYYYNNLLTSNTGNLYKMIQFNIIPI